jgi:predicted Fe-S protein YdhL (DUF1289 family)
MTINSNAPADEESPCVGACMVDQDHGYCVGCWRTLREISDWFRYDPAQKRAVLAELKPRRATHDTLN